MMKLRPVVVVFVASVTFGGGSTAHSQEFPAKPVRILTSAAGGGNDFAARLIAQGMSGPLGQQVIVDNRTSILAAEAVSKAAPDGYTLLLSGSSFWTTPLMQKTPYDPIADFAPITFAGNSPNILVVHPSLPVKTVKELIALAKSRPGQLNYASGSAGGTAHLGIEILKSMAGVNMVHVPYKGAGPATQSVVAGESQLLLTAASAVMQQIKAGRLRAIAVTSLQPSALVPDVPTAHATGLPGFEIVSADALFAPAKTPAAVINRLNQEAVRVLSSQSVKEKFFSVGVETVGSTPEQLTARVKADIAMYGKAIKDIGLRN